MLCLHYGLKARAVKILCLNLVLLLFKVLCLNLANNQLSYQLTAGEHYGASRVKSVNIVSPEHHNHHPLQHSHHLVHQIITTSALGHGSQSQTDVWLNLGQMEARVWVKCGLRGSQVVRFWLMDGILPNHPSAIIVRWPCIVDQINSQMGDTCCFFCGSSAIIEVVRWSASR